MDSTKHILENIRQTYKNDPAKKPNDALYHRMLKSVFRYDTDQKPVKFASQAALDRAAQMGIPIETMDWHSQRNFDPSRGIFHYEHCNPISVLADRVLKSPENIDAILDDNVVCWVLKSEDKKLNENGYKSGRPGGWQKCYQNCGIQPVQINQIITAHNTAQPGSDWIIDLINKHGKTAINRDRNAVQMYKYLIDNFDTDILSNDDYQTTYKDFFRTQRGRGEPWHKLYFEFIESLKKRYKNTPPQMSDYKNELENFYNLQRDAELPRPKVETSFVSKAIHMLNHDLPIYDANVVETLLHRDPDLIHKETTLDGKLNLSEQLYQEINDTIRNANHDDLINEFRTAFGNDSIGISDVKIVDFYYWITR